ncbi:MAG: FkbM family methyltransferase [Bacteroidales bacterium]|nr:FkbM family methyltransferase [Bacteroidales bacterium]
MIKFLKSIFFKIFNLITGILKFPNLKKGEIGIQLGFDMSAPVTSDLFLMCKRASEKGLIIGVEPDIENHISAQKIIKKNNYSAELVLKATYSEKGETKIYKAKKAAWNQIDKVNLSNKHLFTGDFETVESDTLDNIAKDLNIDTEKIAHINITVNGAEYHTLLGMHNILSNCKNLNITVVAGRYSPNGTINGKPDYLVITDLLTSYGFKVIFKRINQLVWWGFFTKLLVNRKWVYNKKNYGIIMAGKGTKNTKWFQSFN